MQNQDIVMGINPFLVQASGDASVYNHRRYKAVSKDILVPPRFTPILVTAWKTRREQSPPDKTAQGC
jgi:hypothetical protein